MSTPPTANYVVLEDDGPAVQVVQGRPLVHTVVVEHVQRRKRGCCGCCCLLFVLVLLLCLFVPRSPSIHFSDFVIGMTSEEVGEGAIFEEASGFGVMVDLNYRSKQPVATTWKDLEVKLEWRMPVDDDGYKKVQVAKFEKKGAFKTKAYAKKHVYPKLTKVNGLYGTAVYAICRTSQVQVRLKGHVHTESDANFKIHTPWTWAYCY